MSIINSQPLIGASGNQSTAYNLTRSLRFRSSATALLTRTPTSLGSTTTWTWSAWVKRGVLGTRQGLFVSTNAAGNDYVGLEFLANDKLALIANDNSSPERLRLETNAVFRDPSAWYHIVVFFNTTNATSSNRAAIYVNGVLQTYSTATYMPQNYNGRINTTNQHNISSWSPAANLYFDGYLAETNFIDGQALEPSSFGETDTATGVWKPKKYTGTYGTNGFYLKFDNLTSTSTLGNDSSGNSNTWTVNNISLTSGSTYDSMKDVPTLTDADTANYCVLNPLSRTAGTVSDGNLQFVGASSWRGISGTTQIPTTGKWYFEAAILNAPASPRGTTSSYNGVGIALSTVFDVSLSPNANNINACVLLDSGYLNNFTSSPSDTGSSIANGDIIGIAIDTTNNTYVFYKNNTSIASGTINATSGTQYIPFMISYNGDYGKMAINFGQRPFAYTPPSGFVALNTFNLPTPTIGATASTQANDYFDVTLYTGNGYPTSGTQSITNSGSMQPDFIWIKNRDSTGNHTLTDSVRGTSSQLFSNSTAAQETVTDAVTAFNSNGFSLGQNSQGTLPFVNVNTKTFVAWQWKANGSGSTNTAGSITSTVSANTTAGFSIVTYTGTGANATVGHGLGVAPSMIIVKRRSTSGSYWITYHSSLANPSGNYLSLNTTDAAINDNTAWNNTNPTSSVFSLGTLAAGNLNTGTFVAYCFAEVAGYSKFGSYTGNGSTDGPFIYCGFRPRFVLIKNAGSTGDWTITDTSRNTYNASTTSLYPNLANSEGGGDIDILSNGFKIHNTTYQNSSGNTMIYAAFAESPFKYSLAR